MGTMRLFHLEWNNAKIPNLPPEERFEKRTADGVQFSTGYVALSNGVVYESMRELEHGLHAYGKYTLTFEPEQIEQGQEGNHAQTA